MPISSGELNVKLKLDDKDAKESIKKLEKSSVDIRASSDKSADKFKEAADKLKSALDKAGGQNSSLIKNIGIAVSAIGGMRYLQSSLNAAKLGNTALSLNHLGKSILGFAGVVSPTIRGLNLVITTLKTASTILKGGLFTGLGATAASLTPNLDTVGKDMFKVKFNLFPFMRDAVQTYLYGFTSFMKSNVDGFVAAQEHYPILKKIISQKLAKTLQEILEKNVLGIQKNISGKNSFMYQSIPGMTDTIKSILMEHFSINAKGILYPFGFAMNQGILAYLQAISHALTIRMQEKQKQAAADVDARANNFEKTGSVSGKVADTILRMSESKTIAYSAGRTAVKYIDNVTTKSTSIILKSVMEAFKKFWNALTNTTANNLKGLPAGTKLHGAGFNPFDRTLWKNAWAQAKLYTNQFINWFNTKFPSVKETVGNVFKFISTTIKSVAPAFKNYGRIALGGIFHASAAASRKYAGNIGADALKNTGNYFIGTGMEFRLSTVWGLIKNIISSKQSLKGALFMLTATGKLPEVAGLLLDIGSKFAGLITGIGIGATIAVQAVSKIITVFKNLYNSVKEMGKLEQGYRAYSNIITASGGDAVKVLNDLRKATQGTVDDATLRKLASTGTLLGISPDKLPGLAEIALPSAIGQGKEITQSFEDMIIGVARMSPQILDNLGINMKDLTEKQEAFAKSIGKTSTTLSDEEKQVFAANYILSKKTEILKKVGNATQGVATNMAIFEAKMKNMSDETSMWVAKGLEPSTRYLIAMADQIDRLNTSMPNLKVAMGAFGMAFLNQVNQAAAAFSAAMGISAAMMAVQGGKFGTAADFLLGSANTIATAAGYKGTGKKTGDEAKKDAAAQAEYGVTSAELKDGVKKLQEDVSGLKSELYSSEYSHRRAMLTRQLNDELALYKTSFEGQRAARAKYYLEVEKLNREFAEKAKQEQQQDIEEQIQKTEESINRLKEIDASLADGKVELLKDGFTKEMAEVNLWEIRELASYSDSEAKKTQIVALAEKKRQEIRDKFRKEEMDRLSELALESLTTYIEGQQAEVEAEVERVEQTTSILEAEDAKKKELHDKELSRMEELKNKGKQMFDEILSIFSRSGSKGAGFLSFIGSQFSGIFMDAAGGMAKSAKAAKDGKTANVSLGQSFKKLGTDIIDSLKQQAIVAAVMEFAAGLASLAVLDFRAAGLHFASSAMYGTVAALQIASAIGAGGGGGTSSSYNSQAPYAEGQEVTYDVNNINPNKPVDVTINALDAQSFQEFAKRNSKAFGEAVYATVRDNDQTRKGLSRGLSR